MSVNSELEICPQCLEDVCNGMGPATMPLVTKRLNKYQIAKDFYRECSMHDMDHHNQIGFRKSNGLFLQRTKTRSKIIRKANKFTGNFFVRFGKRRLYQVAPYIFFAAVSGKLGKDAYKKGGCKNTPKRSK